ncbi:YkgJ family cysteine cluster protein [Acidithiobacillus acidisediminis]|uniref:YkgJ family cysteine cluster protein n=1 Tax=Acidithiobacillus acidisediminis TaxID=2937799 RepID=UPI0020107560|nr:YkgJ family cysteine cluster protein [Acidithiobacillus sp. S30A2]
MQRFADELFSSFSVCQKGCSHCCKYDVVVGRLEAKYISLKTNKNIDIGNSITTNHNSDCPFLLKKGECGIYEYRPIVCRTLHTLDDPSYCSTPDIPHQLYGVSGGLGVGFYENVQRAFFMLTDSVCAPRGKRDIRDWFPD